MYKIVVFAGILCLYALPILGQSCCSSSAASVNLGTSSNSSVLEKHQLKLDFIGFYWQFQTQDRGKGLPAAVADVSKVAVSTIGVNYGLSNSVTISLVQPYLFINSEVYTLSEADIVAPTEQASGGLGDMAVLANWQLPVRKSLLGIAAIGGIELPVGYRDIQNSAVSTSIGSGSYDPILGVGLSKKIDRATITNQTTYKVTTKNSLGIDYGDFFSNRLQVSYSLNKDIKSSANDSLKNKTIKWSKEVFAGTSFDGLFKQMRQDTIVANTGYERFYLHLGAGIGFNKTVRLNVIGEIPLMENLYGYQNYTSLRARAVLSIVI